MNHLTDTASARIAAKNAAGRVKPKVSLPSSAELVETLGVLITAGFFVLCLNLMV